MSTKHLAAGSQKPALVDGKLRLYSMEYCPYAQRSRLVLNAKKIPHDIVNINLKEKPEWLFKLHPEGKVPSIDTGSQVVIESLDISEFLEKKYPEPALYSKNPETKKRDQELLEKIASVTSVFFNCLLGKDQKTPKEWAKEFGPHLQVFESELAKRGTTFLGGNKPGIVDYMLWPWSERQGMITLACGEKLFGEGELPLLKKWHQEMKEDPAVAECYHATEKHWKFIQMMQKKIPLNYDDV